MSPQPSSPANGYVLPTPGRWYDDPAEFARLAPESRPRRPSEPSDANDYRKSPGPERVRQRLRSRPSKEAVAPWGGPFYWCAFCNYVNTQAEGQAVRCPSHRREWNRTRQQVRREDIKARERREDEAPALVLSWADVRELQRLASASGSAGTRLRAVMDGPDSRDMRAVHRDSRRLLNADGDLLALIRDWFARVADKG